MRMSSEQLRQNALLRLQGQIESHQDLQTRIASGRRYLRGSENIVAFNRTMEISARQQPRPAPPFRTHARAQSSARLTPFSNDFSTFPQQSGVIVQCSLGPRAYPQSNGTP